MSDFSFNVNEGNAALAMFGLATSERTRLAGPKLQGGCMAALLQAEWLAATAGVVPFYQLPDGRKGLVQVGAAREHLTSARESVRTLYLATHHAARMSHLCATDVNLSTSAAPVDLLTSQRIGVLPLAVIVALTVTGVAALCAGAWYAKETTQKVVETRGDYLRSTFAVNQASVLASTLIAAGQPVPDALWQVFAGAAKVEQQQASSMAPWLLGGVIVGGVAMAAAMMQGGRRAS